MMIASSWGVVAGISPASDDPAAPAGAPQPDLIAGPLPVIPGLNADYLDGMDGSDFASALHDHDQRYFTEAESDARFLRIAGKAADADLLDGVDGAKFLRSDRSGALAGNLAIAGELRVTNSSNGELSVAIGAGPSYVLEVKGNRWVKMGGLAIVNTLPSGTRAAQDFRLLDPAVGTEVTYARVEASRASDDASGGVLSFETKPAGGTVTARAWIDQHGNLGLGDSTPENILTVAKGSATDPIADAWTTYSSRRWKEDIRPIEDPVGIVEQLRGVRYAWKLTGQPDLGLIAEEVGQVVPEVVQWEPNGQDARSVDYPRLVAVLIEAIKAQQAQLDGEAQARQALEERLERLEAR